MVRGSWVPAAVFLGACALTLACKHAEEKRTEHVSESAVEQGGTATSSAATSSAATSSAATSQQLAAAPSAPVAASARNAKDAVRLDVRTGKVPEDWPSEVPIYPGATVEMSMKTGQGVMIALATPDAASKLTEFYQAKLAGMRGGSAKAGKSQTLRWSDDAKPLQVTLALNPRPGPPTRATLIASRERGKRAAP